MLLKFAMSPDSFYDQSSNDSGIDVCLSHSRSPLPGETASPQNSPQRNPSSPASGLTELNNHSPEPLTSQKSPNSQQDLNIFSEDKFSTMAPQKKYLGVRVRMPVKEILKRLRGKKDINTCDAEEKPAKTPSKASGVRGRVHPYAERRIKQNKNKPEEVTKSLEDLEILVEVLEADLLKSHSKSLEKLPQVSGANYIDKIYEDLHANGTDLENSHQTNPHVYVCQESSLFLSSYAAGNIPQGYYTELSKNPLYYPSPEHASRPSQAMEISDICSSISVDDTVVCRSPHAYLSPHNDFQVPSMQNSLFHSQKTPFNDGHFDSMYSSTDCLNDSKVLPKSSLQQDPSAVSFFQFQLHREESILRTIPTHELLAIDKNGSTLLHKAVTQGKRAYAYVLAKKMVSLNRVNAKDANDRTALHLAAEKNQHLMVNDLISLGGNVNVKDSLGKTPLHLCAENGYLRVLEVLKSTREQGIPVDVDATDSNGLTPLHCAVLAHSATMKEFEKPGLKSDVKKFLTLRKEQLLDGMDFLLQMGANPFKQVPVSCKTAIHLAKEEGNLELLHFFQHLSLKIYDCHYEDYASCSMLNMMDKMSCLYSTCEAQAHFPC